MDAAKGRLDRWIERQRLPPDTDFRFSEPKRMAPEDILLLASWIVKGELGLLEEEKVFRWVGQIAAAPPVSISRGSAKCVYLIFLVMKLNNYIDDKQGAIGAIK